MEKIQSELLSGIKGLLKARNALGYDKHTFVKDQEVYETHEKLVELYLNQCDALASQLEVIDLTSEETKALVETYGWGLYDALEEAGKLKSPFRKWSP